MQWFVVFDVCLVVVSGLLVFFKEDEEKNGFQTDVKLYRIVVF
jgi:hypothetical protein